MRHQFLIIILLFTSTVSACSPPAPDGFINLYSLNPVDQLFMHSSLSADGHILATVGGDDYREHNYGQLFVIDTTAMQVLFHTEDDPEKSWEYLSVSPSGERIVACIVTNTTEIYVVDWEAGTTTYITDGCGATWSPDGNQIAYLLYKQDSIQIRTYNLTTHAEHVIYEYPTVEIYLGQLIWSPMGDRIAFVINDYNEPTRTLNIRNVDGSGLQTILSRSRAAVGSPQFSPSGDEIIYVNSTQGTVNVVTIEDQKVSQIDELSRIRGIDRINGVSISTDGSTIILSTSDGLLLANTDLVHGSDYWTP